MTVPVASDTSAERPQPRLGLFDAASIIVGIIIGAGLLQSTPMVASAAGSVGMTLVVWGLGGLIALVGAACYAELSTRFPQEGGEYVFLTRAYGRGIGFLFAWIGLFVVRPGNIGLVAMVFAVYANEMLPLPNLDPQQARLAWACGSIVVLTALNAVGLQSGRRTQNLLTVAKVVGLSAICVAGLVTTPGPRPPAVDHGPTNWSLALIFVLFAYGGWEDVTYVAAEVRNPRRNLSRALLLGTAGVVVIYVMSTLAFFRALGFDGVVGSSAVGADVLRQPFGDRAARAVSLLICVSCLGAINGMILTGSRFFYAVGTDHIFFRWLGAWNGRRGVPLRSLILQSAVTMGLLLFFGRYSNGFDRMVIFTGPPFWFFFALAGFTVILFRMRQSGLEGYRVPLYPLSPVVLIASSLFLCWVSSQYAWENRTPEAWWTVGAIVVGVALLPWIRKEPTASGPLSHGRSGEG